MTHVTLARTEAPREEHRDLSGGPPTSKSRDVDSLVCGHLDMTGWRSAGCMRSTTRVTVPNTDDMGYDHRRVRP